MDDIDCILAYRQGNEDAFAPLVQKHLPSVYNFIFQMTRDRAVAEDLAQETFIKAWKHIKRFDPSQSFKVWLFAIAKNTAYDFLKKKKTIPLSSFEDNEGKNVLEETLSGNAKLPDEILERKEIVKELERALLKIPQPYRELLILAYREDFSLQEISQILAEPYNTIKSRHNRAIEKLKTSMLSGVASEDGVHS